MPNEPSGYVLDSANECDRLERQALVRENGRLLRHFPPIPPQATLLDAGCGSGAMARLLASQHPAAKVVGVDVNQGYVEFARDKAAAEGLANLSFEQGDVQSLPFEDGSFDVVLSQAVLFYLPRPEDAVREFHRLLRPGGTVLIMLMEGPLLVNHPEDESLQARLERVVPAIINRRLVRRLPLEMRAAGFENIAVEMETERAWTVLGAAQPAQLRNVVEVLTPAMGRIVAILGGRPEADAFLADLLAYLERPDTCTFSALWITKGVRAAH
jgi:ubiquinone/menaquinone biosynthesis C-methylase UbiE